MSEWAMGKLKEKIRGSNNIHCASDIIEKGWEKSASGQCGSKRLGTWSEQLHAFRMVIISIGA